MSLYPLTFLPRFKERVWGGRRLAALFNKSLPPDIPVGESWEICDRAGDVSVIRNGSLAGRDLRWLMEVHGEELLGRPPDAGQRFPWLIKLLDAREDLSLQVHPHPHSAGELGGEPKTELWYFAEVLPGARVFAGLKPEVTRSALEQRIACGAVTECLHAVFPRRGDAMFLPSGRLHALGSGMVVFEFQENSDTTYRVFDWNRTGLDGRPRELHVAASLRSILFDDVTPELVAAPWEHQPGWSRRSLVREAAFHVDEWRLEQGGVLPEFRPPGSFAVLAVASGSVRCRHPDGDLDLTPGEVVLLPAILGGAILEAGSGSTLLRMTPALNPPMSSPSGL
ncbi:MAG: class I mannose-6-phosphate isomerase [Verrucomicrobia bacterium]|nr:class I mannose-6-phosphate isomerase [Verrucomicrobiota bacterium]